MREKSLKLQGVKTMEGYDRQLIMFYLAVWTILLIMIHICSSEHKKLDNNSLGEIFGSIAFL